MRINTTKILFSFGNELRLSKQSGTASYDFIHTNPDALDDGFHVTGIFAFDLIDTEILLKKTRI